MIYGVALDNTAVIGSAVVENVETDASIDDSRYWAGPNLDFQSNSFAPSNPYTREAFSMAFGDPERALSLEPSLEWNDGSRALFRRLVYARAANRTTSEEDALFERLQSARRIHDARENGIDLVKEWLYLQQERELTAFLKKYGSAEASWEE